MTERTVLAWFLLLYICHHVQCARTTREKECPKEGQEDIKLRDQISEAGSFEQSGEDGHSVLQSPLSSFLKLRHASWNMSTQSSRNLIARAWALFSENSSGWGSGVTFMALAGVCMFQVIVLTVLLVPHGGARATPFRESHPHKNDNDSDGSVLALGDALDGFVWWDKSKADSIITSTSQPPRINLIAPPWSRDSLDDIFNESGLAELWDVAKTEDLVEELTGELAQGKISFFMKSPYATEQTGLKCITYVMQVVLHYVPDNLVLQEFTHKRNKNHFLTDELRLPKTKFRNCESVDECFTRCITIKLGLSQDIAQKLARGAVLLRAGEEPTTGSAAAAIPHISTIVRKLTVLVLLKDVEEQLLEDLGIHEGNLYVDARGMEFQWEKVGEDYGLRKLLRKAPDARKVKPYWKTPGSAILPWTPSDINKELASRGITRVCWGKDFSELVKMLRIGQVQLGIEEASGNLVCVEHRVYLKLSKRNGDFLVHEGDESTGARLPYVVLLANETPWIAALRAARTQLGSVFARVEIKLSAQDVQTSSNCELPKNMFSISNSQPIAYVVRETVVEASAC